jgi:hypothetical protein
MGTWCELWIMKINKDKTQGIYFSRGRRPPESHLTLNGQNIPFVYSVKYEYLGVIFNKKVTWRLHIEMIKAKAFRTIIRIHFLFKIERLSTNTELTLHKALIRNIMTYACTACDFAVDNYLLKLQRLRNKVPRTIGNIPKFSPVRDLHMASKLPYIYDYITNYASSKQKPYKVMKMQLFFTLDKANPDSGNIRGLNFAGSKHMTVHVTRLLL